MLAARSRSVSRRLLLLALLVCAGCFTRQAAAQTGNRPNIVFVLVDDIRWDTYGFMGHPFVKTPHIDRMAREGAVFRNAFVTTPLCSPARSSFLTGQYVHTTGIKGNGPAYNQPSHQLVTFPRLLKDAGYETAYVGKWHMGNDSSPRPGFDRWVSFKGQGVYNNPTLNVDGNEVAEQGYITDLLTDYSVRFLKQKHEKPFCLYLAHKAVHGPFTPAERHKELYANDPIVRAPNAQDGNSGKPALTRKVGNMPTPGPGTGSGDMLIRNQLRCLTAIDEGIGRILQALEEVGQLENTMVVYTSDNGYFWGEHGLGDKRWAYEESIRVPLVVRHGKGVKAGTRVDGMAQNIDIAPTFLELGGAKIPTAVEGRSLLPLLRGKADGWRTSALFEYWMEPGFPRAPTWSAVRTEDWKYIRYPELEGMDELYDLKGDPGEMKNRIADPAAAAKRDQLRQELDRLLQPVK